MKRLAVALALTLPMLVAAAPSALAAKPTHERRPVDPTPFTDTSCGFPVQIQSVGYIDTTQWVDASGTIRTFQTFPQAKNILTNLDTGTTITVNVAGPLQITETPDTFKIVGVGTSFWFTHPVTDEPGLFQGAGRFVFFIDAAGNASFQIVGQIKSLCPRLAA
jgi:hypothetical protein